MLAEAEAEAEAEHLEDCAEVAVCCLKEKRIRQMASLREIPPGPWIVAVMEVPINIFLSFLAYSVNVTNYCYLKVSI